MSRLKFPCEVGRIALLGIAAWASAEGAIGRQASAQAFPLYCAGFLDTSGNTTTFIWASQGAGAAAPAPGHCAWADRAPRGSETQPGGNVIDGVINQTIRSGHDCTYKRIDNIPDAQWFEIGVFRNAQNHLQLTQAVGFVTPASGKFDSGVKLPPPDLCVDRPPPPGPKG